jgi:ankyrin repeat protein
LDAFQIYLTANKYLVLDYDHTLMTALHWACKYAQKAMIVQLLELGADINAREILGRTPLYFAIQSGDYETCEVLNKIFVRYK